MDVIADARAAFLSGIYAIVDSPALADAAVRAGVRAVQYRAKNGFAATHAQEIRTLTRARALFILNDRWQDARQFDADGVHVGPDDVPFDMLAQVKAHIGSCLLGVSAANTGEAALAIAAGADYLGVGSVYATASKDDAGTPIGIASLQSVVRASTIPVAAIGGITLAAIPEVKASGAAMAAVIGAIANESDPFAAAAALVRAWNGA